MESKYIEISRAEISLKKNVVISTNKVKGGYIIGQQMAIKSAEGPLVIFLKGAIQVDDISGLVNIKEALEKAIYASSIDKKAELKANKKKKEIL